MFQGEKVAVEYLAQPFGLFKLLPEKDPSTFARWLLALDNVGAVIVAALKDLEELIAHCKMFRR